MADLPNIPLQKATVGVYFGEKIDPKFMLRVSTAEDDSVPLTVRYYSVEYPLDRPKESRVDCEEIAKIKKALEEKLLGLRKENQIKNESLTLSSSLTSPSFYTKTLALICGKKGKHCEEYSLAELKRNQGNENIPMQYPVNGKKFSDDYLRTILSIHVLETILGLPLTRKPMVTGNAWHFGAIHLFRVRKNDVPILFLRYPELCGK